MDIEYLNFQSINYKEFFEFILRFLFDYIIIYIIAKLYFKARQKKGILFALFLLNIVVFIVCYLLQSIQLSIGFAFGIFAIFSILRYRTATVPIKEMTYVFISISIAIINALTDITSGYGIMVFSNIIIIFSIYLFEKKFNYDDTDNTKVIVYNDLSLIKPDKTDELKNDLEEKTGLKINKIEIGQIDFKAEQVRLKIHY